MQQIKLMLVSLPAMLLLASEGVCGSISVCDGRYEIPLFVDDATTKPFSETYSCGVVINNDEGSGKERFVKYRYGFLSYKETIPAEKMEKFLKFIARFINRASGHYQGQFQVSTPIFSKRGTDTYTMAQQFDQIYDQIRYSGAYEIVTKVEGDRTNSYFIEYPNESGPPIFYDRFREWALK
jgi:hypothetical protein